MAQILITHAVESHWYIPIASIKKYNEPDFEEKLWRYSKQIFEHYYVFKFKHPIYSDDLPGVKLEPDLLLVSKSFKKWVIIEVELCKTPTAHTLKQITCFSNPKNSPADLAGFIMRQNAEMVPFKDELEQCFSNPSDLIVVLDDYSDIVFQKFRNHKKQLKICVLEVYRRAGYAFEGYRFGGDYPYELTNSSKLEYFNEQHFQILKPDFAKDLPTGDFEIKFEMQSLIVSVIHVTKRKVYLKMPYHNIPSDIYLQIGKTLSNEFVIQKI